MVRKCKFFYMAFFVIAITSVGWSQLTIKGYVHDERQEPLVGANIIVKGTSIGTITDQDGRYVLFLPQPGKETEVEVSFIGFLSQSKAVNKTKGVVDLDFTLRIDALRMDEVVVTGTTIATTKRQLGNSISTISSSEIHQSFSPTIDRALSGKIAGSLVQQNSGNPAGGISVRLRGTATILGDADPLYIVDGVIVNNDSPGLLYLGGYVQNRLVDLNPEDIERIEVVKGAAAAALYGSRANNGVVQIFTRRGTYGAPRIQVSTRFSTDKIRKTLEVNKYPYDADGNPVTRYDHQDLIFRRAYGTDNYFSISGGGGDTRYFVSGSYLGNQGIVKGVNFERSGARVRVDQVLTNWANLSAGANYSISQSKEIPNGGLGALYGAMDGFIFGPNTYDAAKDPETGEYSDAGYFANPAEVIDKYDFRQKTNRFVGDLHLTLTPVKGMSIDYTFGYDGYTQTATGFIPRGTATPGIYSYGWSRRSTREFLQTSNDLNIRYQRRLAPKLASTSLLGVTMQYDQSSTFTAQSYDLSPVSQIVTSGANQSLSEFRQERVIYGAFAQETFGIAERLFLTAGGRLDASSVFGEKERWQFYPKVSVSYIISDENFWSSLPLKGIFPVFKIRASWGQSGGLTAIGAFDRFTNYYPDSYGGAAALIPSSQQGAEDIRPERETEKELGLDFSLFSNRLSFEMTVYHQHTEDLLLTRTTAPSTGYSTALENIGEIDNRGFELLVRAIPVDNSKVQWNTTLTYARNRNEVSGIEGDIRVLAGSWSLAAAVNGEPLGVYYAWAYLRDEDGNILDVNGDLYTDKKTQIPARTSGQVICGDPNPDFTASWINELKVGRNLNIRAQFDAVIGGDVWNFTQRAGAYYGTLKNYQDELEGKVATGTSKALWMIFDHWIEDGSYIKLRELSITYRIRPKIPGLSSIDLNIAGRNLFSIDDYSGYDPELNTAAQSTGVRGYLFVEPPIPRTFSFGITLNR